MTKLPTILLITSCFAAHSDPTAVIKKAHDMAQYQPKSEQFINAGMVFHWENNRLYQIYTKPGRITDIAFEAGEKILGIAGGDSQRWQVDQTVSGQEPGMTQHLLVKPQYLNLSTNLVVSTNHRVYHLELHAKKSVPYQAMVLWNYPKPLVIFEKPKVFDDLEESQKILDFSNKILNFKYHFVAQEIPPWMPKKVFNDRQKTYIEFPKSIGTTEAPGLWKLSREKKREVINFRVHKNFVIVDAVIDTGVLSLGADSKIEVGFEREQAL